MTVWDDIPDEELVQRAQDSPESDLRAFEKLVSRHQDAVVTNCRYLTRSADDAPDLAQEVFVKAFFGLSRFEGRSSFRSWIQRIKVNHCLNFLRGRKSRMAQDHVDLDDEAVATAQELHVAPAAERNAEAADQRDLIRTVLDRMPEASRVALILRDHDGLAYQEIADDLGIGLSATKMRIKRARDEFRTLYHELSVESEAT